MISLITEKSYILTVKFCQINMKKFYKRINHFDPIAYEDQAYLTTISTELGFLWDFVLLKLKTCSLYHENL